MIRFDFGFWRTFRREFGLCVISGECTSGLGPLDRMNNDVPDVRSDVTCDRQIGKFRTSGPVEFGTLLGNMR